MTLYGDIMPYFDKFIHVYGWNVSILWSPLKIWTPQNLTIANFRHPVSKSWLRPCSGDLFEQCHLNMSHLCFFFREISPKPSGRFGRHKHEWINQQNEGDPLLTTVEFIRSVCAVNASVAAAPDIDADSVLAAELIRLTEGWGCWKVQNRQNKPN